MCASGQASRSATRTFASTSTSTCARRLIAAHPGQTPSVDDYRDGIEQTLISQAAEPAGGAMAERGPPPHAHSIPRRGFPMSRRARIVWIAAGSLAVLALLAGAERGAGAAQRLVSREGARAHRGGSGEGHRRAHRDRRLPVRLDANCARRWTASCCTAASRADGAAAVPRRFHRGWGSRSFRCWSAPSILQYLDVRHPQVYVILYPDGRTNLPAPKVQRAGKGTVETILDLAIGRFSLQNGSFEVRGPGEDAVRRARPQSARAVHLRRGRAALSRAVIGSARRFPMGRLPARAARCEPGAGGREEPLQIDSGRVATAQSQAEFSGRHRQPGRFLGRVPIQGARVAGRGDPHAELAHAAGRSGDVAGQASASTARRITRQRAAARGGSVFPSGPALHPARLGRGWRRQHRPAPHRGNGNAVHGPGDGLADRYGPERSSPFR